MSNLNLTVRKETFLKDYMYRFEEGEYCSLIGEHTLSMFMLYQGNVFIDSFDTEKELLDWLA
tara:strand:- start:119 stop:304 length:186 start_codon:yes stop_codon:yes gene_type:complete